MFWDEIEELRKEENKGREADNWFLWEKKIKYIKLCIVRDSISGKQAHIINVEDKSHIDIIPLECFYDMSSEQWEPTHIQHFFPLKRKNSN